MQTINFTVTPQEMDLLKHTIGYKQGAHGGYRNFYATTRNAPELPQLDHLVEIGLMSRRPAPVWSGDDYLYIATSEGRETVRLAAQTEG